MYTPVRIPARVKSKRNSYDSRGFCIGRNTVYEVSEESEFSICLRCDDFLHYLDEEIFLAYLEGGIFEEATEKEIDTLPEPFVPEEGQGFFCINRGNYISADNLSEQYAYTIADILIGNCFKSEAEAAQIKSILTPAEQHRRMKVLIDLHRKGELFKDNNLFD